MTRNQFGIWLLIAGVVQLVGASLAPAIPTFARRYATSCATCHQAYPRLNGVGESYRLAGYRFVDDEQYRKEQPVEMGDPAYKRLWPKALWPTDIPRYVPLSFISRYMVESDLDGSRSSTMTYLMPEEVELVWAGNLGDDLVFYGDVIFLQKDFGGLEPQSWATLKAWLQFQDLFGLENVLNVRLGTVGTQTMGLFNARDANFYGTHFYLYTTWFMPGVNLEEAGLTEFQGNNFSIAPQMGLEANGFGKRWFYAFGLVNGNLSVPAGSPPESAVSFVGMGKGAPGQDFYTQLAYKFGGIPFDRRDEDQPESLTAGAEFWRDDSLTLSLYAYRGTAQIQTVDLEDNRWEGGDDFWRVGFGAQKMIRDLSLSFAYLVGKNDNPYGNLTELAVDSRTWHAEALGFVYPWLIPYARFESLNLDMPSDVPGVPSEQDIERLIAGAKFMIRPNVSFTTEFSHYTTGAELEEGFDKTLFMLLAVSF